ncbi:hypothetical protein [Lysobacter sp. TY2-98]|uniref:hypothetical protein n=1 Tax=Lysobacter sp. TY2-98 TaxID=2290922 RepID=UPI001F08591F|nr:hypothetical protein [Lysobacter sp. TY2-98]
MSTEARAPLSVLDEILCTLLAVGTVLVVLLPAARGDSALGWLPMWLIGMPAVAWWALHGFAWPRRAMVDEPVVVAATTRRSAPQARRRVRPAPRSEIRRAA